MQRVDDESSSMTAPRTLRRIDSPALGMMLTLPVAAMLWLLIILAAFELFKWAAPAW